MAKEARNQTDCSQPDILTNIIVSLTPDTYPSSTFFIRYPPASGISNTLWLAHHIMSTSIPFTAELN